MLAGKGAAVTRLILSVVVIAAVFCIGCGKDKDNGRNFDGQANQQSKTHPSKTTFVDSRDGKTYKKATIGTQTWMAENLNYDVPGVTTDVCYGDSADNCAKYGRLYDWPAAKKACPAGWHLPSYDEWMTLVEYAGGWSMARTTLKSTTGWNNDGNGTDDYGFSALPGGFYGYEGSNFDAAGDDGYWWSATEINADNARYYYLNHDNVNVYRDYFDKTSFLSSVRCLQDF